MTALGVPATPRRRTLARWLIAIGVLLVAIGLGASCVAVSMLTSRPAPRYPETLPASLEVPVVESRLRTRDGEEIGCWLVHPDATGPSLLLLHCSGNMRSAMLPRATALALRGHAVLVPSLRAHGDSTGERNDFGWSARFDVLACVDELERARPGKPVVVLGTSIGAAAALFAAPELGTRVRGYVLECLYSDLPTAARNRLEMTILEPLASLAYLGLRVACSFSDAQLLELDCVRACADVPPEMPVLLFAGNADRHARLAEMQAIAAALGERAELVVFPGAAHDQNFQSDPQRWCATIDAFARRITAGPR